ncbi:ABC transporter permease subunit, partial [[Haemophilus] ducreyi]
LIMRFVDIMLAIPSLLLTIGVVTILGPSLVNAAIAIAVVSIPSYVRLTRSSIMNEKNRDYVVASKVAGAGVLRLMFVVMLPNCLAPLIVQMTMGISNAILELAALGFLGIGAQPPTPELGTMLAESRGFMQSANWLVTIPGIAILLLVLAFNLMGDGLRDALDPKLK